MQFKANFNSGDARDEGRRERPEQAAGVRARWLPDGWLERRGERSRLQVLFKLAGTQNGPTFWRYKIHPKVLKTLFNTGSTP